MKCGRCGKESVISIGKSICPTCEKAISDSCPNCEYIYGFHDRDCPSRKVAEGTVLPKDKYPKSVLHEAFKVINGERQDTYGNPEDSFALIADYWNTYLIKVQKKLLISHGVDLSDYKLLPLLNGMDVAHMMILFKVARCSGQKVSRDNYTDICGYAGIVADKLLDKD